MTPTSGQSSAREGAILGSDLDCPEEKTWLKKALKSGDFMRNWWALPPGTKIEVGQRHSGRKEGAQNWDQMKAEFS